MRTAYPAAPVSPRSIRLWTALRWLVAVCVLAAVLEPTLWRGLLNASAPDAASVRAMQDTPLAARLQEIAAFSLQDIPMPRGSEATRMANRLLAGQDFMHGFSGLPYALPFTDKAASADLMLRGAGAAVGLTPVVYELPFSETDLLRPDGIGRLPYASLYLPDLLLAAYDASGDERYLEAARDAILAFARYERTRWRSQGSVWNDHALATRAGVLARFWLAWRGHRLYHEDDARELLTHIARTAALLASPRDFNVRTNHGVMQNLGLMQLVLAFPQLEHAQSYWITSVQRLSAQVPFLYGEDGFVLEHSAHYHDVGVHLLAMAVRLVELAGEPVPESWPIRLAAARERLAEVTRPDGTLPAYGDTELEFWHRDLTRAMASGDGIVATSHGVYPLAGYAVWSFAGPVQSHTVVTWSYFPGHGHKLGDELGVLLWGQGRGWVTATGYWDYGSWGRAHTEGWQGSNAPHGEGEVPSLQRQSRLLASAHDEAAAIVVLQRESADGGRFERQVLSFAQGLWLLVDTAGGPGRADSETLWTFFPDMSLSASGAQDFLVRDERGAQMSVAVRSERPLRIEQHRGSRSPFAGWVTMGREGLPAPALRVLAAHGASTATLFSIDPAAAVDFSFEPGTDGSWRARGAGWSAERGGTSVGWMIAGVRRTLALESAVDPRAQRQQLQARLASALKTYPREPNLDSYRDRVAKLLLAGFVFQELALALLRRRWRPAQQPANWRALSIGPAGLWIAGGLWLHVAYFQAR